MFQDNKINGNGDFIHFSIMFKSEPVKTHESLSDPKWIYAMKEELESIKKNETYELFDLLERKKLFDVGWVYKVKENPKGEIIKRKT